MEPMTIEGTVAEVREQLAYWPSETRVRLATAGDMTDRSETRTCELPAIIHPAVIREANGLYVLAARETDRPITSELIYEMMNEPKFWS